LRRKVVAAGKKPLGPWRVLDLATEYAQIQTRRLQTRIEALEERLGIDHDATPATTPVLAPQPEGRRVELSLRGEVTRDKCDALIAKISAAASRDEIVLRITTNGGDHDASVDLSQALLEHKGPTRTIADGACHSAGVTVFMAGDRDARLATANASFLVHAGSFEKMPEGWTNEFARGVESAQSDYLAKMFSRRTGKSWFAFRKMMSTEEGETLSAARAHELGIVSDILPARTRRSAKKRKGKGR
jgi:ATP-dependent protease ClpP protease subunit